MIISYNSTCNFDVIVIYMTLCTCIWAVSSFVVLYDMMVCEAVTASIDV